DRDDGMNERRLSLVLNSDAKSGLILRFGECRQCERGTRYEKRNERSSDRSHGHLLLVEEIRFERGVDLHLRDGPLLDWFAVHRLRESMRDHHTVDFFVVGEEHGDVARSRWRHLLGASTYLF